MGRVVPAGVFVGDDEWKQAIVEVVVEDGEQSHDGAATCNLNSEGDVGLSYGFFQHTQVSTELGNIMERGHASFPAQFEASFGANWAALLKATKAGSLAPVGGAVLWAEPWVSRFKAAGRSPWMPVVQLRVGTSGSHWKAAMEACRILGVRSQRSVCIVFDRAINGGAGRCTRSAQAAAERIARSGLQLSEPEIIGHFLSYALQYLENSRYKDQIHERTDRVYGSTRLHDRPVLASAEV